MGQEERRKKREREIVRRNKRKRYQIPVLGVLLALVIIISISCVSGLRGGDISKTEIPVPELTEVSVLCTGDLVIHNPNLWAAETKNGHDFSPSFRYIKKYIEGADLAFVSLEAPLVDHDYSGYPTFRCPAEMADNLKSVGYDTVLMSSNHTNDAGAEGIPSTVKKLRDAGLNVAGSRMNEEEPRYQITDIDGIKVAIVSYVYGTGDIGSRALNALPLAKESIPLVNSFAYETFDDDFKNIKKDVSDARKAGADVVIMYYHWGEEYQYHSNEWQQMIAEKTANEADVDVIVGSHPHVPQERDYIEVKDDSGNVVKTVPVYYSMGNLLSNQRMEILEEGRGTEAGNMVKFTFTFDKGSGQLLGIKDIAIPYWLDMYGSGLKKYTIVPLTKGYEDNEWLKKSGHVSTASDVKKMLKRILAGKGR